MKRLFKTKRRTGLVVMLVVVAASAIGAYAYFTSGGTGTGTAQTATPTGLVISQVGAGYDSLIPGDSYSQDQCFQCAQISEFGNAITLANPGYQELGNVVVAFRNWNGAFNNVPITFSIQGGPSDTVTPSFPAAIVAGSDPSTTDVTFDFSSQGAFVPQSFVYDISFDSSGNAGGLNVALSSSANDLSVGSDTNPGTVEMNIATSPASTGDFPSCTSGGTVGTFSQWTTDGCTYAPGNPGAYGTPTQVTAGSADIPAVEVNVVGGVVPDLSPGGPSQPIMFAITNPGSTTAHVTTVTTAVSGLTNTKLIAGSEACSTSFYPISPLGGNVTLNSNLAPGQTKFYNPAGYSISMTDDGNNQDDCEGALVGLTFTSN